MVMIMGADFGINVILTGLLVETLGGLSEMVIIETSTQEFMEPKFSRTRFLYYPSGVGYLTLIDGNQ